MTMSGRESRTAFPRQCRSCRGGVWSRQCIRCVAGLALLLAHPALSQKVSETRQPAPSPRRPQELWDRLRAADARLFACQAVWRRHFVMRGDTHLDLEKLAAQAAERARLEGLSAAEQTQRAQLARMVVAQQRAGYSQEAKLSFTTDQVRVVRCEVVEGPPSSKPNGSTAAYLDYTDGTNQVNIEGADTSGPQYGFIRRDPSQALRHSAPDFGDVQFLIGWPVLDAFSPGDSTLRVEKVDELVLERKLPIQGMPFQARMIVSTVTWRPVRMEVINPYDQSVLRRYRTSGYHRHGETIWFPNHVSVEYPLRDGRVLRSSTFDLVDVKLNEDADLSSVQHPLPHGASISDYRFNEGVRYRLGHDTVPSDDAVRRLIAEKRPRNRQTPARSALIWAWVRLAAILFGAVAYCAYFRTRKHRQV